MTASGEQNHNWDLADMPGAGGIRSTIHDMLLFAKANIETPDGEIGKALELAWTKHVGWSAVDGTGVEFGGRRKHATAQWTNRRLPQHDVGQSGEENRCRRTM